MAKSIKKEESEELVIDTETQETAEVIFLRKILQIQEEGGWGKHLHAVINERINELKGE